ncbi:hypothetical protein PAHAL_3G239200 [Panicum hallii]|uniref:Probable zinc-ribbon domain-containing protein n=1 Tax=Panicum hallii TaxID=206008 RepID=A0A2S3HBG4_9POAL|nr:uncharacterized protein LOC112885278 [Panicum hallii]PAN18974.1 hypothetical protein PAHAL_3G239200 [Panicum hallii]PAN18982.2 hypothetical protein PAHAL_3G239200 [Panicum hallii]
MESGEIRKRFGRCPYCRAMVYQDPEVVIYYCSKCRTPIRGKNPVPTEETGDALSRLEILSADTASVFSDELDACRTQASVLDVHGDRSPLFSSSTSCSGLTANSRDGARVYSNEQDERRPLSRRTRRAACSDSFVLRCGVFMSTHSETKEGFSSPRNACGRQRRRSFVGLQELEASMSSISWSRQVPSSRVGPSPLTDPAFQRDLLSTLDSLRGLIAAIEPASIGARAAAARRGARFFRRLESHLARALPGQEHAPRRNAGGSTGSSRSSSASSTGARSGRRKQHHCRPVMGGAPFLVCGSCSELLQVPATTLVSRRKVARLRCGGCEEVLELAASGGVAGPAPRQTTPTSSALPESDDPGSWNSSVRGGGAQPLPLHRALGYSSPSPLLQSRRC